MVAGQQVSLACIPPGDWYRFRDGIEHLFVYALPMGRERIHLVGGPADGKTVDVLPGSTHVSVLLLLDKRRSWVEVSDQPRGAMEGEVVAVGTYARTEWLSDGEPVFRFRA